MRGEFLPLPSKQWRPRPTIPLQLQHRDDASRGESTVPPKAMIGIPSHPLAFIFT